MLLSTAFGLGQKMLVDDGDIMLILGLRCDIRPPVRIARHRSPAIKSNLKRASCSRSLTMADTPFIIQEHQFHRIKAILARLCVECAARVVFLVDRDGQPIAFHGEIGNMDTTSFSSLAAGNVAATNSMAKLIGEETFPAVFHEGERESIFISVIGRSLLVIVFDERSTLGLVKIRSKRASFEIAGLLDEATRDSANFRLNQNAFFAEITDEDIDSLFS
jgi:predicted regulator of Ras-like GTPase activity (Roadblock/LC7/MglB family)